MAAARRDAGARAWLLARLAVLGELVQLAEERYLDPAALEDARARYGQTLGDALRELLSRP